MLLEGDEGTTAQPVEVFLARALLEGVTGAVFCSVVGTSALTKGVGFFLEPREERERSENSGLK